MLSRAPVRFRSPASRALPTGHADILVLLASRTASRTPKGPLSIPIARAGVPTANATKYMQQLFKHWSHKLEVELSERKGVVQFPTARVTFEAGDEASVVRDRRRGE